MSSKLAKLAPVGSIPIIRSMANGMIVYRASNGTRYELQVHGEGYIPFMVEEDYAGRIRDLWSDMSWESLPAMTRELRIEIISIESDPGN